MLLANVYMYELDNDISQNPNVLHYGRYVDDIILVVDVTGDEKNISEDNAFDRYLVEKNNILVNVESGKYTINKYPNLYIQKEKVKIMYFNKTGSKTLINQLLKTITYPSQMNVIPDTELSLVDFEEAAYAKNGIGVETKIRDIGQLEIDRFQLGWHMSQIVMNNRVRKKYVTREEKVRRQNESDSILRFFQGGKALEYSSNWINAMYYFMLTSDTNRYAWKQFQGNIIDAIKQIKVSDIEDVKRNKKRRISSKLKKDLALHFDICISTVLALNIQYCRKEKKTVLALAKKMRKANLFNHHLVSYPLVNYSDDIDENCDLTNILPEQIHSMNLLIRDSKKSKLSPRFINLDEIYQYVFLRKFCNGGNYYGDEDNTVVKKKLEFIENYFYEVNQINRGTASHLAITIKNEMHNEYILQKIELGNKCAVKEKIKIAIANIKLDTKRCCLGLACGDDVEIDRLRLIDFMYRAYANGKNDKVDFLVFPEFYMPLQWISDVLAFVRKSGITVVSGLQYVTSGHQAYNNVAIFAPVNTGRYTSSVLFAREKNDYAPMERQILALEKYICVDQEKPVYQMINNRGIDYGLFLCYEFTDIIARALYKDKVDIIFTPEHNRDTSYFSNIIETTARDLHVFIVQANTSIYGDSRITGPFGRNDRNVLQIKNLIKEYEKEYIEFMEIEKLPQYKIDFFEINVEESDAAGFASAAQAYYNTKTDEHILRICKSSEIPRYIVFHEFTHILDTEMYAKQDSWKYMALSGYTEYHAAQVELMIMLGADSIQTQDFSFTVDVEIGNSTVRNYLNSRHQLVVNMMNRTDFPRDIEALKTTVGVLYNYFGVRSICKMYAKDYTEEVDNTIIIQKLSKVLFEEINSFMVGWFNEAQVELSFVSYMKIMWPMLQSYFGKE